MRLTATLIASALLLAVGMCFSAQAQSTSAEVGQATRQTQDIDRQKEFMQTIQQEKKAETEGTLPAAPATTTAKPSAALEEKILVRRFVVEGATLLNRSEIRKVTESYENKELTFAEIQKVAGRISDIYRTKGHLTSRAYIPPQDIKNGVIRINVVEGKIGNIEVKGNKYFASRLIKGKMAVQPGGHFDFSELQRSLVYINEHPDRVAQAMLAPGQTPGTTDITLNVTDRQPFHVGAEFDNYGSRFTGEKRYAVILEHNNLTGNDDKLFLRGQLSESELMKLGQARYVYPLAQGLDLGFYAIATKIDLAEDFEDLEASGKAKIFGAYIDKALVQSPNFEWRMNAGFDYKKVSNYILDTLISQDELRVAKVGMSFDMTDSLGRTLITPEIDFGIPNILGGMESIDPQASRANAGGEFQKGLLNVYRLQPLAYDIDLLFKNSGQYSNDNLVASEQFQIGGPTSVRGYSPAEYGGDSGLYSAVEMSLPPYIIPKNIKIPGTQESLYDSLRFVAFYDFGWVNTRNPGAGQEESDTLRGWGYGMRLNIRDNLTGRIEVGYPLGEDSSDGSNAHTWFELTTKY